MSQRALPWLDRLLAHRPRAKGADQGPEAAPGLGTFHPPIHKPQASGQGVQRQCQQPDPPSLWQFHGVPPFQSSPIITKAAKLLPAVSVL